jgi:hypothetical protein
MAPLSSSTLATYREVRERVVSKKSSWVIDSEVVNLKVQEARPIPNNHNSHAHVHVPQMLCCGVREK